MPKEKVIRRRSITFIARDQDDIDELVVNFTIDIENKGGSVFDMHTHVLPESNPKHKPKDDKDPFLIYVYVIAYKITMEIDVADKLPNNAVVTAETKTVEKPKIEKATKWTDCPACKMRWGYDRFKKCRCGNDQPPQEVLEDYKKIWNIK